MSGTPGQARLRLDWLPGRYAVCRLDASSAVPPWALAGGAPLVSITRTDEELSIVAPQDRLPPDLPAERDFAALRVHGPLDFALVGILARLAGALADAGVPILAISTHDTDMILVRLQHAAATADALTGVVEVRGRRRARAHDAVPPVPRVRVPPDSPESRFPPPPSPQSLQRQGPRPL